MVLTLFLFSLANACTEIDYSQNGANWPNLCSRGQKQSPVNLIPSDTVPYYVFGLAANDTGPTVHNCQSYYKVEFGSVLYAKNVNGDSIAFRGSSISFHRSSEHQINGQVYDLEAQFFYEPMAPGNISGAIVSILFTSADTVNTFLGQFIEADQLKTDLDFIDLDSQIGKRITFDNYYFYEGSLTEPPCTENILWYVRATVEKMSSEQLTVFSNKWTPGNTRSIQPLNDRKIYQRGGNT